MTGRWLLLGYAGSALAHLALAAAVVTHLSEDAAAAGDRRVPVSLAMFQASGPGPAAAPPAASAPVAEPVAEPEPETEPEASAETDSEPAIEDPPPPEPEPVPAPQPKTVAKPEPRPKRVEATSRPRTESTARKSPLPTTPPVRPERPKPKRAPAAVSTAGVDAVGRSGAPSVAGFGDAGDAHSALQSSARQAYLSALVRRIQAKKYYPRKARRQRHEGEVLVAFTIEPSGRLSDIRVERSSGSETLDRAAIRTLEKVSPFRAPPEDLGRTRWELAVPIAYRLRD